MSNKYCHTCVVPRTIKSGQGFPSEHIFLFVLSSLYTYIYYMK